MKLVLALLALSLPIFSSSVACAGGGGDAAAIQSAVNAAGTVTITGNCGLGSTSVNVGNAVTINGSATLNRSGGYSFIVNTNNVTITGLTFQGAAAVYVTSPTGPGKEGNGQRSNFTFTGNTCQNTNGNDCLDVDPVAINFNISNNTFINGYGGSDSPSTNCNGWSGGCDGTGGTAIQGLNGWDHLTMDNNTFDLWPNDGIHLGMNVIGQSRFWFQTSNNSVSYNKFSRIHRIPIESQGTTNYTQCSGNSGNPATNAPGTPADCTNNSIIFAINVKVNGNYAHDFVQPFFNTFGYSLVDGWAGSYANNAAILNNWGSQSNSVSFVASCIEVAGYNKVFQGNVCTSDTNAGSGNPPGWGGFYALGTGPNQVPTTWTFNNNIGAGPSIPANTYEADCNFNGVPCPGPGVTLVKNSNFASDPAPNAGALTTPTINFTLTSSSTSGGVQTFNYSAVSRLPVKWVQWTLDGSPTVLGTQEIQDISSTFPSDRGWLYHFPITLASYTGTHALTATATDVSGFTRQVTTNFTGGAAGPGISFTPSAFSSFGNVNTGSSSAAQTITIKNTGTVTITGLALSFSGTNAGDFSQTNTCGSTLAVSATCTVSAMFTPTSTGARSASLNVADSVPGAPQLLPVSGTGQTAGMGLLTNYNFSTGSFAPWVFDGGTTATATVDATGACSGNSAHITFTGNNIGNNQIVQSGLTLPPNGTPMQLDFDAQATRAQQVNALLSQSTSPYTNYGIGSGFTGYRPTITTGCNHYSTTFTVTNSPAAGGVQFALFTNNGQAADQVWYTNVILKQVTGTTTASLAPATVPFGGVSLGNTGNGSLVLQNTGTLPVNISSVTKGGTNAADFGFTNGCGATLAVGASCPISVTFTPSIVGSETATITVADNATNTPHVSTLAGTGTQVVVTNVDFVSHSSARMTVKTSLFLLGGRSRAHCVAGPCTTLSPGDLVQPFQLKASLAGVVAGGGPLYVDITGLTAGSTYNLSFEGTTDGTNYISILTTSQTFPSLPSIHPALPIPPKQFKPPYPNTAGFTAVTVANDCSNLGSLYTTAVNVQQTTGTVVSIPPGACTNLALRFALKPKDVVTWNPADVNLSDSSITLHGSTPLTTGQGIRFGMSYASFMTFPATTSCKFGQGLQRGQVYYLAQMIDQATNRFKLACGDNGQPTAGIVFTTQGADTLGTGFQWVPEIRQNKWIIFRPTTPDIQLPPFGTGATPAYKANQVHITNPLSNLNVSGPNGSAITFGDDGSGDAGNVDNMIDHIWLSNFFVENPDSPGAHTSYDPKPWRNLIYTYPTNSNIVIERSYLHNQGTPNRVITGAEVEGYNVALDTTYSDNALYYHSILTGSTLTITGATTMTQAAGTINYGSGTISVVGHTIAVTGSGSGRVLTGVNPLNSNVYTVWTTPGYTASCSPACTNVVLPSASTNPTCDYRDQWPLNPQGDPAVGPQACATISSGSLTSVQIANATLSQYWGEGAQFMTCGLGPGPLDFTGDYWDGVGIMSHCDDGGNIARQRGDTTFYRNYFLSNFQYMYSTTTGLSDGLAYYMRQPSEVKSGSRFLFDGIIWDGFWTEGEASSNALLLTSVNGQGITDVNVQNSTMLHGPGAHVSACVTTPGGDFNTPPPCPRWRDVNNLSWDINSRYSATESPASGDTGTGWLHEGPVYAEDMIETNNTYVGNVGPFPAIFWMFDSNTEGMQVQNNIFYVNAANQGLGLDGSSSVGTCAGLFGKPLGDCKFTPNYVWSNNLMIGNGQTPSAVSTAWGTLAASNYFQSVSSSLATVGWYNYAVPAFGNGNPTDQQFDLMDSAQCKAGSTTSNDHSQDCGANMVQLRAAQGWIKPIGVTSITTSGFNVEYLAPDAGIVSVDVCAATDLLCINPITRFPDNAGTVARSSHIVGLATKTFYNIAIRGQGNWVTGLKYLQAWTN